MNARTIAVFDSGVGGLSVLRALHQSIPGVHWVYCADSAFAPYGERSEHEVQARTALITRWLWERFKPDALVLACNTATAWAIDHLRKNHPALPIVGVEPAIKPAALLSKSGHVAVVATSGTLASPRYAALQRSVIRQVGRPVHVTGQACPGLADAIESGDELLTRQLCGRYAQELQARSVKYGPVDTLVLGCTHYPFAMDHWLEAFGQGVTVIDNAPAIARRVLALLAPEVSDPDQEASALTLHASGSHEALAVAAQRWINDLPIRGYHALPV